MLSPALMSLCLSSFLGTADAAPRSEHTVIRRAPIDYTAWSLEPGEVRVGPVDLDIGIARGVQVGSDPLLDAVGVYNGRVRLGRRLGRVGAAALDVGAHHLQLGEFKARHARVGLRASAQAGRVGMHLSATGSWFSTEGTPDLTAAAPLVEAIVGQDKLAEAQSSIEQVDIDLDTETSTVSLRAAVDVRLGGPHSLVLQGGQVLYRDVELKGQSKALAVGIPDDHSFSKVFDDGTGGAAWGSLAWQYSGKHLQLRLGAGISEVSYAWIMPTTELSWRFGGPREKKLAVHSS